MQQLLTQAFRNARSARGYTTRYLAQKLGVAQPLLSRIEQGQQMPSPSLVKKLESLTKQPLAAMVKGQFDRPADPNNFLPEVSVADWHWEALSQEAQAYFLSHWQVALYRVTQEKALAETRYTKKVAQRKALQPQLNQLKAHQQKMTDVLVVLQAANASAELQQFQQQLLEDTTLELRGLEAKVWSDDQLIEAELNIHWLEWQCTQLTKKTMADRVIHREIPTAKYLIPRLRELSTETQVFLASKWHVANKELETTIERTYHKLHQKAARFHLYNTVIDLMEKELVSARGLLEALTTAPSDIQARQQAVVSEQQQALKQAQVKAQSVDRVKLLLEHGKIEVLEYKHQTLGALLKELEKLPKD